MEWRGVVSRGMEWNGVEYDGSFADAIIYCTVHFSLHNTILSSIVYIRLVCLLFSVHFTVQFRYSLFSNQRN